MSVDSFFFVRDAKLPTVPQWQSALDHAGVGIVLEDVGNLREHTGYLPATHRGRPSGFEWFYGPVADNFGGDLPDGLDGRDYVVNCVTHSDMRELVCGLVACSVLSQLADGVFLDQESGALLSRPRRWSKRLHRKNLLSHRDVETPNKSLPVADRRQLSRRQHGRFGAFRLERLYSVQPRH